MFLGTIITQLMCMCNYNINALYVRIYKPATEVALAGLK